MIRMSNQMMDHRTFIVTPLQSTESCTTHTAHAHAYVKVKARRLLAKIRLYDLDMTRSNVNLPSKLKALLRFSEG